MFKHPKNSKEYRQALKAKEDISKIYKEIEFDTIRECFKEIMKIDNLIDSNFKIKDEIYDDYIKCIYHDYSNICYRKFILLYKITACKVIV